MDLESSASPFSRLLLVTGDSSLLRFGEVLLRFFSAEGERESLLWSSGERDAFLLFSFLFLFFSGVGETLLPFFSGVRETLLLTSAESLPGEESFLRLRRTGELFSGESFSTGESLFSEDRLLLLRSGDLLLLLRFGELLLLSLRRRRSGVRDLDLEK